MFNENDRHSFYKKQASLSTEYKIFADLLYYLISVEMN